MTILRFKAGSIICAAGEKGPVYRVHAGSLRVDRHFHDSGRMLANLAIRDDLVGSEILMDGFYSFEVQALTDCELIIWDSTSPKWMEQYAKELLSSIKRKTDVASLRYGSAKERILGLINLLKTNNSSVEMPKQKDISEITDLTIETVSRTLALLSNEGIFQKSQKVKSTHLTLQRI